MQKRALKVSHNKSILRFMLGFCLSLVILVTFVLFTQQATAADSNSNMIEIVKEKKYKGAADESELKILAVLPAKKNKVEVSEESTEGF